MLMRVARRSLSAGMQWQVTIPFMHLYNTYKIH
jgi:hypothetical protein